MQPDFTVQGDPVQVFYKGARWQTLGWRGFKNLDSLHHGLPVGRCFLEQSPKFICASVNHCYCCERPQLITADNVINGFRKRQPNIGDIEKGATDREIRLYNISATASKRLP